MNKHKRKAADADAVLSQVRKLREKQGAAKPAEGPSTLSNVREVSEMPAEVVVAEIERLVRAHASVCAFVCADFVAVWRPLSAVLASTVSPASLCLARSAGSSFPFFSHSLARELASENCFATHHDSSLVT